MPTKRGERHLCLENNILCLKRNLSCTVHAVKDTKSNVCSATSQCILHGGEGVKMANCLTRMDGKMERQAKMVLNIS